MEDISMYPQQTIELKKIAEKSVKEQIIPWTDKEIIGISILKNYPPKSEYKPVLFRDGKPDSVALIKVGFWVKDIKNSVAKLEISVSNASRYKFKHYWYNYDDNESPSEKAVILSESTRQPTGIEDKSRYEYHLNNKKMKFFDTKSGAYVSFKLMIEEMYNIHLKTLTNKKFILLTRVHKFTINLIEPINNKLIYINFHVFGKRIKKSNNINDYSKGTFSTYKKEDLEDVTQDSEKMKILGSDFPISPQSARTFLFIFSLVFFINYLFGKDIFGLISLINSTQNNSFFLIIITSFLLYVIDRLLPYGILYLVNALIKLRLRLYDLKIHIE